MQCALPQRKQWFGFAPDTYRLHNLYRLYSAEKALHGPGLSSNGSGVICIADLHVMHGHD